jgi:thioredoxin reductase
MVHETFDVVIVGAGPAGLNAALMLGRARRRVLVCDHGKPRNYASKGVHGFLGLDGLTPTQIRERGRKECECYGVRFIDREVVRAEQSESNGRTCFELEVEGHGTLRARKLLLATGVQDQLPDIPEIESFYGKSVHHCPYCDGWEHRDQRLVAYGSSSSVVELSIKLLTWSPHIACCMDGRSPSSEQMQRLLKYGIEFRAGPITQLEGSEGTLKYIRLGNGADLQCDALFFSAGQVQRSSLPAMLGCELDEKGAVKVKGKQGSGVNGLFLAGDADDDVQFAIVAAAEGAKAATAINAELQSEDYQ